LLNNSTALWEVSFGCYLNITSAIAILTANPRITLLMANGFADHKKAAMTLLKYAIS